MLDQNNTNPNLPTPRRAVTELPDQASVDTAGIDLPLDTARLVSCVIFRQAARGRSKTRTNLYDTIMGLVFLGRQAIERNGETDPASFPDLPMDSGRRARRYSATSVSRTVTSKPTAVRRGVVQTTRACHWSGRWRSSRPRFGG
jgi:hypothetical protein